jgi:nitrite reductase/ring-hydroxylating ferredoxin subunit
VTAFDRIPRRYTAVMDAEALRDGEPATADLNGVPIFLLRRGDTVFAMHDRCTHRGGPLHRGKLEGDTIVCPWHGSCFRIDDAGIERGPATAPQPSYLARIHDRKIEVRGR